MVLMSTAGGERNGFTHSGHVENIDLRDPEIFYFPGDLLLQKKAAAEAADSEGRIAGIA